MALTMDELKALNEEVRKILEERERTLADVVKVEESLKPPEAPPKQAKLF